MIPRYRLLSERVRAELRAIEQVVERAEGAVARSEEASADQMFFIRE